MLNVLPSSVPSEDSDSRCFELTVLDIHLCKMISGCDLLVSIHLFSYILLPLR